MSNQKGKVLFLELAKGLLALIGHPLVALGIGAAIGVGLLLMSRASFRTMTPAAPEAGLTVAAVSLFLRMAFAAGVLLAYKRFVPEGFVSFAAGLAGGFFLLYSVELVRYGRVLTRIR